MTPIIWLGVLAVLLVMEAASAALTTIWFAGGALVAALLAYAGMGIAVQLFSFFVVSLLLLYFTRPLAMRYMNKTVEKTNAEGLIGKTAVVLQKIDNLAQTGQVRVNDIEWMARSKDDKIHIPEGAVVTICEIRGVKLIVEEKKED